mgnify:CR=1 FL=1
MLQPLKQLELPSLISRKLRFMTRRVNFSRERKLLHSPGMSPLSLAKPQQIKFEVTDRLAEFLNLSLIK